MARQRASQAREAFARVGTAPVDPLPASEDDSVNAIISASENDGINGSIFVASNDVGLAVIEDGEKDAGNAGRVAISRAGRSASRKAGRPAGRKASRRVGRPPGPEREAVTVRLLTSTNARLTAAVEQLGQNPQTIVETALVAYLDALGIPATRPSA